MTEAFISLPPYSELPDSVVTHHCQECGSLQEAAEMLKFVGVPGSAEEQANDEMNYELYCREWIMASSIAEARASTLAGHRARAMVCNRAREFQGNTWLEDDAIIVIVSALIRDLVAAA